MAGASRLTVVGLWIRRRGGEGFRRREEGMECELVADETREGVVGW